MDSIKHNKRAVRYPALTSKRRSIESAIPSGQFNRLAGLIPKTIPSTKYYDINLTEQTGQAILYDLLSCPSLQKAVKKIPKFTIKDLPWTNALGQLLADIDKIHHPEKKSIVYIDGRYGLLISEVNCFKDHPYYLADIKKNIKKLYGKEGLQGLFFVLRKIYERTFFSGWIDLIQGGQMYDYFMQASYEDEENRDEMVLNSGHSIKMKEFDKLNEHGEYHKMIYKYFRSDDKHFQETDLPQWPLLDQLNKAIDAYILIAGKNDISKYIHPQDDEYMAVTLPQQFRFIPEGGDIIDHLMAEFNNMCYESEGGVQGFIAQTLYHPTKQITYINPYYKALIPILTHLNQIEAWKPAKPQTLINTLNI